MGAAFTVQEQHILVFSTVLLKAGGEARWFYPIFQDDQIGLPLVRTH